MNIDIPHYRNPNQIKITSKNLSPLDNGQLELTLVIANQAVLAQLPPSITVKLYNFNGDKLAQRRFTPTDYLPRKQFFEPMAVNQAIEIRLPIVAPGNDIPVPVGGFTITIS